MGNWEPGIVVADAMISLVYAYAPLYTFTRLLSSQLCLILSPALIFFLPLPFSPNGETYTRSYVGQALSFAFSLNFNFTCDFSVTIDLMCPLGEIIIPSYSVKPKTRYCSTVVNIYNQLTLKQITLDDVDGSYEQKRKFLKIHFLIQFYFLSFLSKYSSNTILC